MHIYIGMLKMWYVYEMNGCYSVYIVHLLYFFVIKSDVGDDGMSCEKLSLRTYLFTKINFMLQKWKCVSGFFRL